VVEWCNFRETSCGVTGSVKRVSSLDISHYKEVVGHYVTGVVVISALTNEGPVGFTCQTFSSLSLDPILISFAAKSAGNSWLKIRGADAVGLNMLGADQVEVARIFATSGIDKFVDVAWSKAPHGSPLLAGAIAHLEGQILSVTTHGDHDFAVVAIDFVQADAGSPLLYYRGDFGLPG
jgi:3-hydroxy-9,10-secoandrosta-1,3,5(10)-triene-9,17-dione monooxygenase reductase component